MTWYRKRRRLAAAWRNHRWVDLGAVLIGALAVFLPTSESIVELQNGFLSATAGVIAVLVAVVTFACAFVYQADSERVVTFRARHSTQLKSTWLWCVGGILVAVAATLAAIVLAYWSPSLAWCVAIGALAFSVALTVRSLDFLRFAMS